MPRTDSVHAKKVSLGPGLGIHPSCASCSFRNNAPVSLPKVRSLAEAMVLNAQEVPDAIAFYLFDIDERLDEVTNAELLGGARRVAATLRDHGIGRGERVVLTMDTGLEYLSCFFACSLLGAVPVPLYPPADLRVIGPWRESVERVMRSAGCRVILTEKRFEVPTVAVCDRIADGVVLVDCATRANDPGEAINPPAVSGDELAFIQYTSGTTALPKGVKISHAALLANLEAIIPKAEVRDDDVNICWLPLYHDMGLVGSVLGPVLARVPVVLMPPLLFLFRPRRWLWAVHHFRGTYSAAPSFAYGLCTDKIDDAELEGLDLRSWRVAFNGAENIDPDTVARFGARFERYGFSRKAMYPVYGMAESTLAATFPLVGAPPRIERVRRSALQREGRAPPVAPGHADAAEIVSTGRPFAGHDVAIFDSGGRRLGERRRGEIALRGPSLFSGYVNGVDPQAVRDGWFYTGDLGFVAEGELFVCGRIKDLIIKGGRNLHPFDIEQAAASVDGVRAGNIAAFGVNEGGSDDLIIALEIRMAKAGRKGPTGWARRWHWLRPAGRAAQSDRLANKAALQQLEREVEHAIFERVGVRVKKILVFPPMTLPKTSSGKLSRAKVREMYLGDGIVPGARRGNTLAVALELGNVVLHNATARLRKLPAVGALVERLLPRRR